MEEDGRLKQGTREVNSLKLKYWLLFFESKLIRPLEEAIPFKSRQLE